MVPENVIQMFQSIIFVIILINQSKRFSKHVKITDDINKYVHFKHGINESDNLCVHFKAAILKICK